VGVIYHGASVVSANCNGKMIQVAYDTPHLVEAMAPACLAGPLKSVVKSVWKAGGQVYWRKISRPLMQDEEATADSPTVPAPIPAVRNLHSGTMIEVGHKDAFTAKTATAKWSYCTDNLQEQLDANARLPKDQRQTVNIDVLDKAGRAALAEKLEDMVTDEQQNYRLRVPLTYQEWNQSCKDLAGTDYEDNFLDMVDATISQDAGCWDSAFGEGCCERTISAEAMTDAQRKDSQKALFCSELAALQLLRAGWRMGKDKSDKYLPKDFTDEPHESLSQDLREGVKYGALIQIMPAQMGKDAQPFKGVVRGRGLMRDVSDMRPELTRITPEKKEKTPEKEAAAPSELDSLLSRK